MLISPNEMNKVLKVTGNEVTNNGKKYFEQGRIKLLEFKYVSDKEYFVKALVEESLSYEVQIKKINNMLKYKCDCLEPSKKNIPCKHVISVLFDIYINPEKYMEFNLNKNVILDNYALEDNNFSKLVVSDYINYYESLQLNSYVKKERLDIKVIPELSLSGIGNSLLNVSFKIGNDKLYKIKDLYDFADNVLSENKEEYGKNLKFKHELASFDESCISIVDFIVEFISTYKSLNQFDENIKLNKLYKSKILLKYGLLDKFFNIYLDKSVECENFGSIKFVAQDPIFKFSILSHEDIGLNILDTSEEYYIFHGLHHVYILYQNKLYQCSEKFKTNMLPLIENFKKKNNNLIRILDSEKVSFCNFVIPSIKDFANIESDENILEKYKLEDLGVKVFLDIDENSNIIAILKFCYKNIEFNPFDEDAIITCHRNIIKETKVKELFEKYQFKLNVNEKYLFLDKEDSIYEFLTNGIELFMQKFEVLVTDRLKNKQIIKNKNLNVGVRVNNNLIEIDIENLNLSEYELKEIFKRYKLKKKYFRLKDGSFLNIDTSSIDTLYKFNENFAVNEKEISNGIIKVPKYRALALEKILNDDLNINCNEDGNFKQIIKDIKLNDYLDYKIPRNLNGTLRNYQKTGFNLLKTLDKYNFGGILADDMGLGKTLQVITLLLDEKNLNDKSISIVVCPTSLYINWEKEIHKFAPDLKTLIVSGTQKERIKLIKDISKYNVIITSYDILKRDIEYYKDIYFRYIIADEAQYIKNNNTKNAIALKKLNASTRFALTGTPIENSLSELWSIFDFCMPGYLYSYKKFKDNFEIPIIKDEDKRAKEKLKMLVYPFILRRTKKEVLKELPEKTETIMYNQMNDEQENLYNAYLADTKLKISEELKDGNFEKNKIKILSLITRLRQICSHPSLFVENFNGESSKLNQCIELIEDAISSGHKILLFSGFTSMFDIITKILEEKNIKYYMLTGKTNVNDRAKMVEEFNELSDINVFLISLKAGGTGLNLIGADMVIHYDPWWNLAVQNQATDRAYRIGQKSNVQVFKLITKGTIEEKMIQLQEKKKDLLDSIVSDNETFIQRLTKEEIMELFEL